MESLDRRQNPRVDIDGPLRAEIPALGIECNLLDVSFGGFLVETTIPFSLGDEHEFLVTTGDRRQAAVLKARAVYCHRRTASETDPTFASGFGFLDPEDPATRQAVLALVDHVGASTRRPTSLSEFVQFWQSA